jgi:hypothetical protein
MAHTSHVGDKTCSEVDLSLLPAYTRILKFITYNISLSQTITPLALTTRKSQLQCRASIVRPGILPVLSF